VAAVLQARPPELDGQITNHERRIAFHDGGQQHGSLLKADERDDIRR
jgi:hypothetical protein